jgi:hypothetical protein
MSQAYNVHHVAQQLLNWETAHSAEPLELSEATGRVCTRLRLQFARLLGNSGCDLLMNRALRRAAAEHPILEGARWHCSATGALEGFPAGTSPQEAMQSQAAGVAMVAAFLSLLLRFIGEDLTRRQLERAWPELQPGNPATEAGA